MKQRGFEKISLEQYEKDFMKYISNGMKYEDILLPKRSTNLAAGYDFFSPFDFILKPNDIIKVPTGIKSYMLDDEYLAICDRSGVGFKYNVRLCNQIGIIDADYYNNESNEGHIFLALQNEGSNDWVIKKGDKIVQGIFQKYLIVDNEIIEDKKRIGGLGSTNKEV
jgi:dUTP pyrophosphatase